MPPNLRLRGHKILFVYAKFQHSSRYMWVFKCSKLTIPTFFTTTLVTPRPSLVRVDQLKKGGKIRKVFILYNVSTSYVMHWYIYGLSLHAEIYLTPTKISVFLVAGYTPNKHSIPVYRFLGRWGGNPFHSLSLCLRIINMA